MERSRSEELLYQMLPPGIPQQLKKHRAQGRGGGSTSHSQQHRIAQTFDEISVLFTDVVGFTRMSARFEPSDVMSLLDEMYSTFDVEIERSGCYKVETIGDSVMVVGGAFGANLHEQHRELVRLATRLLECIALLRAPDGTPLQIRAGIHTGTAIGGVVGLRMPRFTFMGDTINTASRMESTGIPMKLRISLQSFTLLNDRYGEETIRDEFHFKERTGVEVKGKGQLTTYLYEPIDTK